jgi:hypothetical protein
MTKECGLSSADKIQLAVVGIMILGFILSVVQWTKSDIERKIDKVDVSVVNVSKKLDTHIEYHLNNKICQPKEEKTTLLGAYYGEKEKQTSQSKSPR